MVQINANKSAGKVEEQAPPAAYTFRDRERRGERISEAEVQLIQRYHQTSGKPEASAYLADLGVMQTAAATLEALEESLEQVAQRRANLNLVAGAPVTPAQADGIAQLVKVVRALRERADQGVQANVPRLRERELLGTAKALESVLSRVESIAQDLDRVRDQIDVSRRKSASKLLGTDDVGTLKSEPHSAGVSALQARLMARDGGD